MRWTLMVVLGLLLAACDLGRVTTPPTISPPTEEIIAVTATPLALSASPETTLPPPVFEMPQCDGAPPTRMIVQERGRVTKIDEDDTETLNLRAGPGIGFPVLKRIPPGELFFVLDGPTCGDQYAWYQVVYNGQEGWLAEGDENRYFMEPYLPG